MDCHPQSLNVVTAICSSGKIWQVELNLVPPLVQSHWHGTNERFYSCSGLVVWSSEPSSDIFVIEDLDFKSEVFFQLNLTKTYVLDDHDQERKLNSKSLFFICGTGNISRCHIRAHDFQDWRLDVLICETLDVAVVNWVKNELLDLSHIWRGLLPILYKMDRKPDW